jgi:hypothetical protein
MSTSSRARAARTAPIIGTRDTDSAAATGRSTLRSVPPPPKTEIGKMHADNELAGILVTKLGKKDFLKIEILIISTGIV